MVQNRHRVKASRGVAVPIAFAVALLLAALAPHAQGQSKSNTAKDPKADGLRRRIRTMEAQLASAPDPAATLTRIGLLYLRIGDARGAEDAFEGAIDRNPDLALAHLGLGRTYLELMDKPRKALSAFVTASRTDTSFVQAYSYQVEAHLALGNTNSRAQHVARKTRDLAPDFAPAYLLTARYYQSSGSSSQATIFYYNEYLKRNPADQGAAFEFALNLLKEERFAELEKIASGMTDPRALPFLGQALIQRRDHEAAVGAFERYVDSLDETERELYENIALVGNRAEIRAYNLITSDAQRDAFLRRFWLQKDPFRTSGGAMRRAEHYRRVWYARTHYGKKWPWDKRGEVYIRWGEPQYRSTSRKMNPQSPLHIQRIQEMMAHQLYGDDAMDQTFVGPVYPIRTQREPGGELGPNSIGLESYKPVTAGGTWISVPWEVWVYPTLSKGVEITFTDEFLSGNYGFAPIPTLSDADMQRFELEGQSYMQFVQILSEYAPEVQITNLAAVQPEIFDVEVFEPLDFFYERLAFRGENGKVDLQINIGLPIDNVALPTDADTVVVVERRTALVYPRGTDVRTTKNLQALQIRDRDRGRGLLALSRVDHLVDPGEYELSVQALRLNTNHTGVYREPGVLLPNFDTDRLELSHIQIARNVTDAAEAADSTFVRGNWSIRPAPSAIFQSGESLYVFFEVYNLTRDEFGATRYEIRYEFQHRATEGFSLVSMMGRLGKKNAETVGGSFEQTGSDPTVSDYIAFDLPTLKPGRYTLTITVNDLNAKTTVSREGIFRVPEK